MLPATARKQELYGKEGTISINVNRGKWESFKRRISSINPRRGTGPPFPAE